MITRHRLIPVVALLATLIFAADSTKGQREFRSSFGFSVMYPSNWFRFGGAADQGSLHLLSSRDGGAEAVGIKHGAAEITVQQDPEVPAEPLAKMIEYYTHGGRLLSRSDIPRWQRGTCDHLQQVVWEEAPVPPQDVPVGVRLTDFVFTGLFCRIEGRNLLVILKNWEGDKHQQQYQHVALRMARSIRVPR